MDKSKKSRPYAVVHFPEENATSVVPVSWLTTLDKNEGTYQCYWPNINADAKSKSGRKPDKNWKVYLAHVQRLSKTYQSGVKYMERYQYESEPNVTSGDDGGSITDTPKSSSSAQPPMQTLTQKDFHRLEAKVDRLLDTMTEIKVELALVKDKTSTLKSIENLNSLDVRVEDFRTLQTIEDLQNFEETLKSEEEFAKCVKTCGCLGGKDEKEAVRRILQKIFSHGLALQLGWNQNNTTKASIQNYPSILLFITVSLRANPCYKGTPQNSVEDTIKRWLRYACDRNGGRMQRMKKMPNKANSTHSATAEAV